MDDAATALTRAWLVKASHDPLGHLLSLAAVREPSLGQWTSAAEILTPYATAFRYPATGEDPMPTRSEFEEALRLADAVFAFVLALLPPAARPATE